MKIRKSKDKMLNAWINATRMEKERAKRYLGDRLDNQLDVGMLKVSKF